MLQVGSTLPTFCCAMDSMYHQWRDDVLVTPFVYEGGALTVPTGPGLGVELDREKLERYAEAARQGGGGGGAGVGSGGASENGAGGVPPAGGRLSSGRPGGACVTSVGLETGGGRVACAAGAVAGETTRAG